MNRRQFLSSVLAAPFIAALKPEDPIYKFFDKEKLDKVVQGIDWGSEPDYTVWMVHSMNLQNPRSLGVIEGIGARD